MFTVTLEGAEALAHDWVNVNAAVRAGMRRGVRMGCQEGALEARTKHTFTNRTGDLERSIVGEIVGSSETEHRGEIRAAKHYASFVDEGTRPHIITAKNAKALRWEDAEGVHFAKRVRHPGSRAKPFMHLAYYKAERVIIREIEIGVAQGQTILNR